MKTNKELCAEFNKLTGDNVTRFSSKWRGRERIAALSKRKITRKCTARKKSMRVMVVKVNNKRYPSIRAACVDLGLSLGREYKQLVKDLRILKTRSSMGYKFKNIVRK